MIRGEKPLSKQVEDRLKRKEKQYNNDFKTVVSTGSTLLDLAISGGVIKGGGIPPGILVEIFGPSGSGKTILLCEIAGSVRRKNGEVMFRDPEARLNIQFAKLFDLDISKIAYDIPDTIPEVFAAVRSWKPDKNIIHGIFADSLAALSTDLEMENKEGDKMGMRRAKEFSEEMRKTCRILAQNNYLMVCSNQVRQNLDAGMFGQKYTSPGGEAIGFYSSLRLRTSSPEKIKTTISQAGKDIKRVVGINVLIEIHKSSIDKPYRTAPVTILFDYGIDDIRQNLQYIKTYTKNTMYCVNDRKLSISLEDSINIIEEESLESELKQEVIILWEKIEQKFSSNRTPKLRF